jgi:predicted kinase
MDSADKPLLVIFSGPPCSLKSTLAKTFAESHPGMRRFGMDEIREEIQPGPIQDKPRRNAAYRVMHFRATQALLNGQSVILDATYIPQEHRQEIAQIVLRLSAQLYVVQCWVSPEEAVKRFCGRGLDHAAVDLTPALVAQNAQMFNRFDGALVLDTTRWLWGALAKIDGYLKARMPVDPIRWARHDFMPSAQAPGGPEKPYPQKISRTAVGLAKRTILKYRCIGGPSILSILAGFLSILPKLIWVLTHRWFGIWAELPKLSLAHLSEWGTFCFAAGGVAAGIFTLWELVRANRDKAMTIKVAGKLPRYDVCETPPPSDIELYHAYRCRLPICVQPDRDPMAIPNVPIYFVVLPERGLHFPVLIKSARPGEARYSNAEEAKHVGMDWTGFVQWRAGSKREEYYRATYERQEYGVRCASLDFFEGTCLIEGCKCAYLDNVCREHAVNLRAPGILPDMRRRLEGPDWDTGGLDLGIRTSFSRYSMFISATSLVVTSDDYLVLQRRSDVVATGIGSLGASAAGAADWYCDWSRDHGDWLHQEMCSFQHLRSAQKLSDWLKLREGPSWRWSLRASALREISEEIGLSDRGRESDFVKSDRRESGVPPFDAPFIGAAYNLRWGRDLNFYCCFRTNLRSEQVADKRRDARDRWEVANLIFLHRDQITVDRVLHGDLEAQLPNRGRHLIGLLYAWAIYSSST